MNTLLICATALTALTLASSSPVTSAGRPQRHEIVLTMRGPSVKEYDSAKATNTHAAVPHVTHAAAPPVAPAAAPPGASTRLRKGEYMCGDRVCALQPGQLPAGCNGLCQYRINI